MPETSILTIQPLHATAFRPLAVAAFLLASISTSMAQHAPAPGASEAPAGLPAGRAGPRGMGGLACQAAG